MIEIKVPELAESISEGTILKWAVREGDAIKEGDLLLELETDKVNAEITSDENGVIKEICKEAGETALVGEVIAIIQAKEKQKTGESTIKKEETKAEEYTPNLPNQKKHTEKKQENVLPPSQRKKAREQPPKEPPSEEKNKATQEHDAPINQNKYELHPSNKPMERKRMSRRRKTIATHLVEATQSTAMLTTFNEIDMSSVMDIRKRKKASFQEKNNTHLGFMSFFTKAVVASLKTYPLINAEVDGEDILFKHYYDIGIAVAADEGLVVPVIRDADRLSFAEIEKEITRLAEKARTNKLTLEELRGGTFTITNGGVFGSLLSTPILNSPQVGILGMHTIQKRPVTLEGDKLAHRPMMYVALSYDHRIVDGKEAVGFLVKIKNLLEDPELLLFG